MSKPFRLSALSLCALLTTITAMPSIAAEVVPTLVKDIYPGSTGSEIRVIQRMGDLAYFAANDGVYGKELWRSDGTEAGTYRFCNFNFYESSATEVGSVIERTIFVTAKDDYANGTRRLWCTNGMDGIYTTNLMASPMSEFRYRNVGSMSATEKLLFFGASTVQWGIEPWISDGTSIGTRLLRDINAGSEDYSTYNSSKTKDLLFFFGAYDGSKYGLWKSDGTQESTVLLKNFSSLPCHFAVLGDKMLFNADDEVHGQELWQTDGTCQGTQLL